MAIPSTGTSWKAAGLSEIDPRFGSRGSLAAILIRDNRGSNTNISPWVDNGSGIVRGWSPFALDGNLRDDLFYTVRVNGEWTTNPAPNEGFWLIGAVSEDGGVEREPNISQDDAMVLQSNFPFASDITEEGISINFTGVETLKPLMMRLRMNLPLVDEFGNSLVEDAGTKDFVISKSVDADQVDRQIVLIFAKRNAGRFLYTAEGYSLCKLTDIGASSRSKTDLDANQLTFTVLPDPYLMDKDPANPSSLDLVPAMYTIWMSGPGWTAIGGLPVFPDPAPVATQTGATTATVVFDEAVGASDPFTYTCERAISPFTSWTTATIGSTALDTPTAGKVTLNITGLTTATQYKFRVKATGSNGNTSTSQQSNTVTTA